MLDCVELIRMKEGIPTVPRKGDRKALVTRDNRLVRSAYWLTPAEKRFLYWLFWRHQQTGEREQVISISELGEFCEVDQGSVYRTMYDVCHRLQSRVVVIWNLKEDAPSFINFTESITPNLGQGTIRAVVHSDLVPLLKDFKENFTTTAIETAVRLSSFYSMRLYDLAVCHKFRDDGVLYGVDELKAELGVLELVRKNKREVEIKNDRYPEWKKFKQKVLDRALTEVNDKTDVEVTLEVKKTGRQVTHVRLHSRQKEGGGAFDGLSDRQSELLDLLRAAGMTMKEARNWVDKYGESDPERIRWHVKQSKKAKTPLAWLRAGIKKDYRLQTNLFSDREEQERDRRKREAAKARRDRLEASGARIDDGFKGIGGALNPQLQAALERVSKNVQVSKED